MARKKLTRPTDTEIEILRALWERGPSTVRDVQAVIEQSRETGYTTVLKLLQIMTEKGLVRRDESNRAHVYAATCTEEETQTQLVGDLLQRAFGGSAMKLIMRALDTKITSPDELSEIRKLLRDQESSEDERL